jgi:hypothetical protein
VIGLQAGLLTPFAGNTYCVSSEGAVCRHSAKYRQMGLASNFLPRPYFA